jgi:5-enolpyruvylshikimate-3-phosphate synthase
VVDIHHAGTAMRFLTAFFAVNEGREVVLTGSQRMTERPIKVLVEALEQLETIISYEKWAIRLFESKDKDNGFEGKYSCKCKQSIHFGFNVSSAKIRKGIEINWLAKLLRALH